MKQQTFALYFGNRGFFPGTLIAGARRDMKETLEKLGYGALLMDGAATRNGAVETAEEGRRYAAFLKEHRGEYDGVILSLPNFGDENGAIAALEDCGTPILIQAYPDEFGKMDFQNRRDAFCGKLSIMDVFCQHRLPFTVFEPHTVHPLSGAFQAQVEWFAAVCRIAGRMKRLTVGALGARTTAFKTVRFDELALQKHGVSTEALDLSELFLRVRGISAASEKCAAKKNRLKDYTTWPGVPEEKLDMLARAAVAIDDIIEEYRLDCLALRCWMEFERELGVSPCLLLSELNDRGVPAACELDVCNAVSMYALSCASRKPAACLDWNNNYGGEPDKCVLFHCGPVPQSLMAGEGHVTDHPMFAKDLGPGCGFGCNEGRIAAFPMTYASSKTEDGKFVFYLGEGRFTDDPIEDGFFGCGGVAQIGGLQAKLPRIGRSGFRHHVSVTPGHLEAPVREAFTSYLGYEIAEI